MGALRKLWLRFSWRPPVTWSLRHSVAGTQRRKQTALKHETYLTRKTQPGTNWRVFWQSITPLSSSSKTPGKATGSVSDWTHVRSLASRKSKWTMGGCGALRRCGCARTYEGPQFLCVKFRLGSAGEPTICSHCYDVLNEDMFFNYHIDGLVQDCNISITTSNALEIMQSCTKPSTWSKDERVDRLTCVGPGTKSRVCFTQCLGINRGQRETDSRTTVSCGFDGLLGTWKSEVSCSIWHVTLVTITGTTILVSCL